MKLDRTFRRTALWCVTPSLLLILLAGCGGGDDGEGIGPAAPDTGGDTGSQVTETPAALLGTWEEVSRRELCNGTLIEETTSTHTFCPDQIALGVASDDIPLDCTYTWDGTRLDYECAGEFAPPLDLPGCTTPATIVGYYEITDGGDRYVYESIIEVSVPAECGLAFTQCEKISGSAQRISSSVESCGGDGGDDPTPSDAAFEMNFTGVDGFDLSTADARFRDLGYAYRLTAGRFGTGGSVRWTLDLPKSPAVGEPQSLEELGRPSVGFRFTRTFGDGLELRNQTGTITVTEATGSRFRGTFQGNGDIVERPSLDDLNPVPVTFEGSFDAEIEPAATVIRSALRRIRGAASSAIAPR